jgi:hypothetical protein
MNSSKTQKQEQICSVQGEHKLHTPWVLWYHDIQSRDWSLDGYQQLVTINTIEDFHRMIHSLYEIENNMYYLMRQGIPPLWDDSINIDGGAWTFKVNKKDISEFWTKLAIMIIGETICAQSEKIVGISISPKLKFATVRVWTSSSKPFPVEDNFSQARFTPNQKAHST